MNVPNIIVKSIITMVLLLIFAIAFAYRIVNLETDLPSLYNNELYILLSAYAQLYGIGYLTVNGYIPSMILFYLTPLSGRLLVALYGSFIVFPIYLLTNELIRNKNIAFVSTIFWTISPSAVVTSWVVM